MSFAQFLFWAALGSLIQSTLLWTEQLAQVSAGKRDGVSRFGTVTLFISVALVVALGVNGAV